MYHGGHPIEGVMPSPYLCKRFHPTRGCSWRKYLFLNFANATPRMQFAKAAPPGFEFARLEADLSSLSNSSSRALTSVATTADSLQNYNIHSEKNHHICMYKVHSCAKSTNNPSHLKLFSSVYR